MNERDSKLLYKFKKELIERIKNNFSKLLSNEINHIATETIEEFLHPEEENKIL